MVPASSKANRSHRDPWSPSSVRNSHRAWLSGLIPGLTTHPAKVGDVIIIYATGLGAVDSPPDNGQGSLDKLRQTVTKPTVMVGGITANVLFAGLSPQFVGVNQLNVIIP